MSNHNHNAAAILAPTGIVAFNIGGRTIHSFFKLPVQHTNEAKYFKLNTDGFEII